MTLEQRVKRLNLRVKRAQARRTHTVKLTRKQWVNVLNALDIASLDIETEVGSKFQGYDTASDSIQKQLAKTQVLNSVQS
jgi:hypothetical protein